MARRAQIVWTKKAEEDYAQVLRYIRDRDSPQAARKFARRLNTAVKNLRGYPEAGSPVEDLEVPGLREMFLGSYRILYRFERPTIQVVGIHHGAQTLRERDLPSE